MDEAEYQRIIRKYRRVYTEKQRLKAISLFREGKTLRAIGKILGIRLPNSVKYLILRKPIK